MLQKRNDRDFVTDEQVMMVTLMERVTPRMARTAKRQAKKKSLQMKIKRMTPEKDKG